MFLWQTFRLTTSISIWYEDRLAVFLLNLLDTSNFNQIHWPVAFSRVDETERFPINLDTYGVDVINVPLTETWKAMEALVKKGKVKSIGVSNFIVPKIEEVWNAAEIKTVVNQVELHPYFAQTELVEWCQKKVSHSLLLQNSFQEKY